MPGSTGGSAAGPASRAAGVGDPAALTVALVGPTDTTAESGSTTRRLVDHTLALADELRRAGHEVTLVSWSSATSSADPRGAGHGSGPVGLAVAPPRTWHSLSRTRPDTWARTGRRLRAYDTVLVMHTGPAMVPLHLALLRAAGAGRTTGSTGSSGPRGVLLVDELLPAHPHAGVRSLLASFLGRVDGVLVHRAEQVSLATRLGAGRVVAVARPDAVHSPGSAGSLLARPEPAVTTALAPGARRSVATVLGARAGADAGHRLPTPRPAGHPGAGLELDSDDRRDPAAHPHSRLDADEVTSAAWARYIGAIEALSAPSVSASDLTPPMRTEPRNSDPDDAGQGALNHRPISSRLIGVRRWPSGASAALGAAVDRARTRSKALVGSRPPVRRVQLDRADLPDWILFTDVLDDAVQADDARAEAVRLGLRRHRDGIAAWAALGALAAIVRVADDGRHTAVVVDESGSRSPLSTWARAVGFAPVDLGVTLQPGLLREPDLLELDAGGVDVVARIHPGGCDASDLDETLSQSSWVLRTGGLLILTIPLGSPGTELALGPADVRGVVARADEFGFVLVGDLDGEIGRRMRRAAQDAGTTGLRSPGAAYGLVRLTLRRR